MLRFRSLASGSAGNATLIEASDGLHRTLALVDCGLGWRQLGAALARCGLTPDDIDAVFITHEHGDHVGCAPLLVQRHRAVLWTSTGTGQAIREAGHDVPMQVARDGQALAIGALCIQPFTVPHDAREPLQLRCTDGARDLGILTDLGHVTAYVLAQLAGCHALMLESNHCPDLLALSHYPPFLKRRVGGAHGHLSNAQSLQALAQLHHHALRTVVGAHLSEHNNRPDLVQQGFAQVLGCAPAEVLVSNRHGLGWLSV